MSNKQTRYLTLQVDGLNILCRDAGPENAPALLLLHGFPSSGRMFQPLFERLSDRYRLIAPDFPGFGHSDWPNPSHFQYTFDNIATIITHFTEALNLTQYTLCMQDYGGPVGFRMILTHPQRLHSLIVQNAVAHNEGLGEAWAGRRAFWVDRSAHQEELRRTFLSFATTRARNIGEYPQVGLYDPDLWTDEYRFLSAPEQAQAQTDLFYDYRTNVDAYLFWQLWTQKNQPKLLVLWGKHDPSFDGGEPERFREDIPNTEIHILDAGHFAMDTKANEIAALIEKFMHSTAHSSGAGDNK